MYLTGCNNGQHDRVIEGASVWTPIGPNHNAMEKHVLWVRVLFGGWYLCCYHQKEGLE